MTTIQSIISTGLQLASVIPGTDVIGVFNQQGFSQLFQQARPLELRIKEMAKVMQHPIETGSVITDHEIFLPQEVEIDFLLTNGGGIAGDVLSVIQGNGLTSGVQSLYQQIRTYYTSGILMTIHARSGTYNNMIIYDIAHKESAEMFDSLHVKVKFRQVQFVTAQYATLPPQDVVNQTDSSTQQIGEQNPVTATQDQAARAGIIIGNYSQNLTGVGL